jgi:hypothetical protein
LFLRQPCKVVTLEDVTVSPNYKLKTVVALSDVPRLRRNATLQLHAVTDEVSILYNLENYFLEQIFIHKNSYPLPWRDSFT